MTVQVLDKISYEGLIYSLADTPLEMYWELKGMYSPFPPLHTANWKGYEARWSICDGQLFLNSLMHYSGQTKNWVESLGRIFPDSHGSVWAHWYTGRVRFGLSPTPGVPPKRYLVHFKQEMSFEFKNGRVLGEGFFHEMAT